MTVQNILFQNFIVELEQLITDIEKILETTLEIETTNRLDEMKDNEMKTFSEDDYNGFIKQKFNLIL